MKASSPMVGFLGVLGMGLWCAPVLAGISLLEVTQGIVGRELPDLAGPAAAEARQQVEARDWAEAARSWGKLGSEQGSLEARLWHIACLIRADEEVGAQQAMLELLASARSEPRVLLQAAWVLEELGRPDEAASLLKRFPTGHPDSMGAAVLRMRAYTQADRPRKAERARAQALRLGSPDAWFWLEAGMEDAWRNRVEAELELERATRSVGSTPFHAVVYMRHLQAAGRPEAAVRVGLSAMERFPEDIVLPNVLASVVSDPRAEAALVAALLDGPNHPSGHAVLGLILIGRDDLAAATHLTRALALGEHDPNLYLALSQVQISLGDVASAVAVLREGARRFPDRPYLVAAALAAAHAHGDLAGQLAVLEGMAVAGDGQPEAARTALLVASSLDPAKPPGAWAEVIENTPIELLAPGELQELVRGEALAQQGRDKDAEHAFEDAVAARESDVLSLAAFARFLLAPPAGRAAEIERGQAFALQAETAAGTNAAALDLVAAALWDGGERHRAVDVLSRAIGFGQADARRTERLTRWRATLEGESL